MASAVKRASYDPYRNIGYAYDGSAARVLDGEEVLRPRPHVQPRHKQIARPQVEVRPAGKVSLFAVTGFAAVAVMAVLILMSFVQLSAISGEMVSLDSQMTDLRSEEATLRARYELVYVDLTEPDHVVVYNAEEAGGSFLDTVEEMIGSILSYF